MFYLGNLDILWCQPIKLMQVVSTSEVLKLYFNWSKNSEILGHENTYFLIRSLNFWSKVFIFNFWRSQCSRLLSPCTSKGDEKNFKKMSFHQYSWNSEVEKTWISLIGWPHKSFIAYVKSFCMHVYEKGSQLLRKN
jgi:hypothetical protein